MFMGDGTQVKERDVVLLVLVVVIAAGIEVCNSQNKQTKDSIVWEIRCNLLVG